MSGYLINAKVKEFLSELFDSEGYQDVHDVIVHSQIYYELIESPFSLETTRRLNIIVNPTTYKKYHSNIGNIAYTIKEKYIQITLTQIDDFHVYPDLEKYQLVENKLVTTPTPWETINVAQDNLIKNLKEANQSIDFQNIGNSSRTLLQSLAEIVFDSDKHKAETAEIALDKGKFKNRLHTFIKSELTGENKSTIRGLATSLVSTAGKSIDLSNELTHDLSADSFIAEICVVSTLSVINIVRLINSHSI